MPPLAAKKSDPCKPNTNWNLQNNPSVWSSRHLSYTAQKGVRAVFKEGEAKSLSQSLTLFWLLSTKGLFLALVYSSSTCGLEKRREEVVGLLFKFFLNGLETPSHRITSENSALAVLCWISCIASGECFHHTRPCIVSMSWRVRCWRPAMLEQERSRHILQASQGGFEPNGLLLVLQPHCVSASEAREERHILLRMGPMWVDWGWRAYVKSRCGTCSWAEQSVTAGAWERSLCNDCVKTF